jgi:NAD(P)-dependent dehydrogenase (short-subunit alcohol dehydrogenase family)
LAQAGYEVHGTYHTSKEAADKLAAAHGIIFHQADLSKRENTRRLANELATLPNICGLVNNAGIWVADKLDDMEYANWDATLEINLTAPLILSLAIGKAMRPGGSIVNIASTDGMKGAYDGLSYSASKAGLINLTQTLGIHFGPKGTRVNAIAPGWIDTAMVSEAPAQASAEMTPLRRNGRPEEIANVVAFLLSDKASYLNCETITVDGGLITTDWVLKKESE